MPALITPVDEDYCSANKLLFLRSKNDQHEKDLTKIDLSRVLSIIGANVSNDIKNKDDFDSKKTFQEIWSLDFQALNNY